MIKYKTLLPKKQTKLMQKLESILPDDDYAFWEYPSRDGKMYLLSGSSFSITWYARAAKYKTIELKNGNELLFDNDLDLINHFIKSR